MNRRNGLILLVVVLLTAFPLLKPNRGGSDFGGTDDKGVDEIARLQPDYRPWFHALWTPPGGEVQSLLFSLQAALGAGVLGYYFGFLKGRSAGGKKGRASD